MTDESNCRVRGMPHSLEDWGLVQVLVQATVLVQAKVLTSTCTCLVGNWEAGGCNLNCTKHRWLMD
jgi:hypothetical protein